MKGILKRVFWKLPIGKDFKNKISQKRYERILLKEKIYDEQNSISVTNNSEEAIAYTKYILESYGKRSREYKEYSPKKDNKSKINLVAYYLTQFHPNDYNDKWWGKGTTEWNNVNKAIPQFVGHYQPRRPGELGYYDLRIKEIFERQIEIAHNYGIGAFCFYYYWFDGKRLLEYPLNKFLSNKDLDMKFFYCWANENWTKRFSGTNDDVLMYITPTEENYKKFIESVIDDFKDERYYRINNKPVISIYRPSLVPNPIKVISYWREKVKEKLGLDLYIIAVQERTVDIDWNKSGFDAETEFQPKQIQHNCLEISKKLQIVRKDFAGDIYDYKDLVDNKRYWISKNMKKKVYPAVMPMWDNTARRNFRGTIFHGSTPELYKKWLSEVIKVTSDRNDLDEKMVFINAWNEWGEGAYLEPDSLYGYAYLEATYEALKELE